MPHSTSVAIILENIGTLQFLAFIVYFPSHLYHVSRHTIQAKMILSYVGSLVTILVCINLYTVVWKIEFGDFSVEFENLIWYLVFGFAHI